MTRVPALALCLFIITLGSTASLGNQADPNQHRHNPTGFEHRRFRENAYFLGTFGARVRKSVVAATGTAGHECGRVRM